jgi:MarR family transcriptional regulator, organic hydroperoxide resistance regulator
MFEQCLYFNTMSLARTVEKAWTDAFRRFGLTPPQAFCLRAVIANPGCRPSALADTLGIARATATRLLDHLQRKGLIERQVAQADSREFLVVPTAKAKAQAKGIERASAQMTAKVKAVLGESQFVNVVGKLRSAREELG